MVTVAVLIASQHAKDRCWEVETKKAELENGKVSLLQSSALLCMFAWR